MASGHLCLNLTSDVDWTRFPAFARELMTRLGGQLLGTVADGVDMRIFPVSLYGARLSLVWDDYPAMVSLEASDSSGDDALRAAFAVLSNQSA
jgi:hypothetical protein